MVLIIIYSCLILIGTNLIKNAPVQPEESNDEELQELNSPINEINSDGTAVLSKEEVAEGKDSIIPYVTSRRFIHIYLLVLNYLFYGFFFGTTYKVIGKNTINDD